MNSELEPPFIGFDNKVLRFCRDKCKKAWVAFYFRCVNTYQTILLSLYIWFSVYLLLECGFMHPPYPICGKICCLKSKAYKTLKLKGSITETRIQETSLPQLQAKLHICSWSSAAALHPPMLVIHCSATQMSWSCIRTTISSTLRMQSQGRPESRYINVKWK